METNDLTYKANTVKKSKVTVKYIDINTNEEISEQIVIDGYLDKEYGEANEFNFDGHLCFSGKYKYGKRSSGIEYNINRKLIFAGEYMDDSRWNGKFYSPDQKTNKIIKNGTGYI